MDKREANKIIRAVIDNSDIEFGREKLPAYVDAQLDSRDADGLFPFMQDCLAISAALRAEYNDLLETMQALRAGEIDPFSSTQRFDLSFLPTPSATSPQPTWQTQLRVWLGTLSEAANIFQGQPALQTGVLSATSASNSYTSIGLDAQVTFNSSLMDDELWSLDGYVQQNKPLSAAQVLLLPLNISAEIDSLGFFTLESIPAGTYTLFVRLTDGVMQIDDLMLPDV